MVYNYEEKNSLKDVTVINMQVPNTEGYYETNNQGEFSSKLRIECLVELGHEVCTHRPSPSTNKHDALKPIHMYQLYERRQVITR